MAPSGGGRQGLAPEGPTHPTGAEVLDWIFRLPAEQLTVAPGMQSVKRDSHTTPRSCAGQPSGAADGQINPIDWSLQLLSHYAKEPGAPGRQVRTWAERQRGQPQHLILGFSSGKRLLAAVS